MDYPASRKPEHILGFAKKMSSPAVTVVKSYGEAIQAAAESEEGIGFVAYHPEMVGDSFQDEFQKSLLTQVFGQVARKNQHLAHFILLVGDTNVVSEFGIEDVSNGFVAKIELNIAPTIWKPAEVSSPGLLKFVKEQNLPLVSALGPHNFHKIGNTGRPMVIAAVDTKDDAQVERLNAELKEYALTGPREIVDQYYFGWMDGKMWQKFLEQFEVSPNSLPQIFVLDVPSKKYWQDSTYTTVKDFMAAVAQGEIPIKFSSGPQKGLAGTLKKAEYMFFKYLPWSLCILVTCCVLIVIMIMPAAEEMRPPYSSKVTKGLTKSKPVVGTEHTIQEIDDGEEEPKKDK